MRLRRRARRTPPTIEAPSPSAPRRVQLDRGDVAELVGAVCAVVAAYQALGTWAAWACAAVLLLVYSAAQGFGPPPAPPSSTGMHT